MNILSIETSCDETSVAIISAAGGIAAPKVKVLSHTTLSQIQIHQKYGGVFPHLAQREHQKNLVPILIKALEEAHSASSLQKDGQAGQARSASSGQARSTSFRSTQCKQMNIKPSVIKKIMKILEREPLMLEAFLKHLPDLVRPPIDVIAVTNGPGLEPALWVGVNFAKALGELWGIPVIPVNHMEGHIASAIFTKNKKCLQFPLLALLVSGGHTELVYSKKWGQYTRIGETRDDAAGECFDKVARMLSLPYPGGPEISHLAAEDRKKFPLRKKKYNLPSPMIHSKDYVFSFSGLKTAVMYTLRKIPSITKKIKREIAREFEDAVVEVLVSKTKKALEMYPVKTLIAGGGVIGNPLLRKKLTEIVKGFPKITPHFPPTTLATDNALMIATAGYMDIAADKTTLKKKFSIKAFGNLKL